MNACRMRCARGGATTASPARAPSSSSNSSSGLMFLSRYPWAPLLTASNRSSSSSETVSMMIFVSGSSDLMRRVASMPSHTGIRVSMRMMLGGSRGGLSTRPPPFGGPHWDCDLQSRPRPGAAVNDKAATGALRPFLHGLKAKSPAPGYARRVESGTVVTDDDAHVAVVRLHVEPHLSPRGVLLNVGPGFLDEADELHLSRRREHRWGSFVAFKGAGDACLSAEARQIVALGAAEAARRR